MVLANQEFIGKKGTIRTPEGLTIGIKILDVKTAFGNERFQVTPLAGDGTAWVSKDRVTINQAN